MTSRLIDMSSVDDKDRHPPATSRSTELSYVLVADGDVQRTAACLEQIKAFNLGVLVARDGEEAIGILQRFGPPILLITDLSLPRKDGFAVIEALREMDAGRTEIIAWSALRELREFAVHRLAGLNVKILGGSVAPPVLRGAIERALRGGSSAARPAGWSAIPTVDEVHRTMTDLADKARELCGTPGVAVYLKAVGQTQFRAAVTWTSEVPMPDSPPHLPRVFDVVLDSGDALVMPDLAAHPLPGVPRSTGTDAVRGLVAVPIVSGAGQVVGVICVFDVKPVDVAADDVEALKELGRTGAGQRSSSEPPEENRDRPQQKSQPDEIRSEERQEERPAVEPASLLDRRGGALAIARELARVRREQRQLSVIMFDVDPIGRTSGGAGSIALSPDSLQAVSETLARAIRGSDLAIQWDRDELLVVLPGLSGAEARQVAERVRAAMQAGAHHRVSVSGGVAELLANETVESAVARANEKVRLARERGHNRVG